MRHSQSAAALGLPFRDANGEWSELGSMPPPRSIQKPYHKSSGAGRRKELSAFSDALPPPGESSSSLLQERASLLARDASAPLPSIPRLVGEHVSKATLHGIAGLRPTNRSEAAYLAAELSKQLEGAKKKDFRHEQRVYDEVFKAVSEQVAVQCGERGQVLERWPHRHSAALEARALHHLFFFSIPTPFDLLESRDSTFC